MVDAAMLYAPFTPAMHIGRMDLSFARRAGRPDRSAKLELSILLARIAAIQAATPTARAQSKLDRAQVPVADAAARLTIFAPMNGASPEPLRFASFAATSTSIFMLGQPQ